jgi:hypothetical protein
MKMPEKFYQIYQFKISLDDITPTIWRRIQVPESYSFWDLHVAIQDAMGWQDCHLHQFIMPDPTLGGQVCIGIPDDERGGDIPVLPGWEMPIAHYFSLQNKKASYEYDFGDGWCHTVLLETIMLKEPITYPVCLAGKRACPPEDCGGTGGYENLIEIMKNPQHEEYESVVEWLGKRFDPEAFGPERIRFADPKARWKQAIQLVD